jgi:hypothetical protein
MTTDRTDSRHATAATTRPPVGVDRDQACGYFESSGDLARGVDVTIYPMQALPDALVRELTQPRHPGPSGPLTNPWAEVESA